MNEQENILTVRRMFAALGEGELQSLLDMFAENVDFQSPVSRTKPSEISWAKSRNRREEVGAYFIELLAKVQPERLEPLEFIAQGENVVVEGKNRGTVRSTGKTYEHDWVMVIAFHNGKIIKFKHYYDTSDVVAAFH
jgi:ketosteroid isomerase-like protein